VKTSTRYLTRNQFRGLNKIGDAFIPGDQDLPSFSACGCARHADRVLAYLPDTDRQDLKMLLALFRLLPRPFLALLVRFLERAINTPGRIGVLLRLARLGLKGLIMSLYYSGETGEDYTGPSSLAVLGYEVRVYLDDLRP